MVELPYKDHLMVVDSIMTNGHIRCLDEHKATVRNVLWGLPWRYRM